MNISRRNFLKFLSALPPAAMLNFNLNRAGRESQKYELPPEWKNPPREFSQAPFWFWNDDLSEKEIARQIADFRNHGVYGFIIHPRAGLPEKLGFMSDQLLRFIRFAIEEADRNGMWVILYDEGMYPSGSGGGLVAAANPLHRPRALFAVDLDTAKPGDKIYGFEIDSGGNLLTGENQKLVTVIKRKSDGHRIAVADRYVSDGYSVIRGLHYLEENPSRRADRKEVAEETPPAADILNPEAVRSFINIVYQKYYNEFGRHFGKTVKAIFTDEPSFLGRRVEKGAVPGNSELLKRVGAILKKDFTEYLPALFYDDEPDAASIRAEYNRALNKILEETYYIQISDWCADHGIALTGHPAKPDDIGHLRYFQIPGQDIVWRDIEPGKPSALEGPQSTQAKCASSAMIHYGKRRNSNEYCGAYGHNFTFREMKWLANWLLVRGCNLLYPHAFYYSVRGPRVDERPPDVGPNNLWWDEFKPFTDSVSRLCWINTDSRHICDIAILGLNDFLPWKSAEVCFKNQYDFNYLEYGLLKDKAVIDSRGINISGMNYKVLIVEDDIISRNSALLETLGERVIFWNSSEPESAEKLLTSLQKFSEPVLKLIPQNENIRVRRVVKDGINYCLVFNEGETPLKAKAIFPAGNEYFQLNQFNGSFSKIDPSENLRFEAHEMKVVAVPV